jgi:GTPase-associated protein 1, N-terminal domain type 2
MLNEMVSAPVPHGLFKGTSGFCPVAVSKGMPKELIQLLADLSKRQYEMAVANQTLGREIFSHLPLTIKGRSMYLLARGIQMPNEDPSRQKFVVHQLLLENVRDLTAGPAWVLANDKGWINQWNHEPQFLETREIENCSLSPRICETWAQVTGDAGWGGVALEAWQRRKPFALVIPPTMPSRVVLDLFVESQSLMDQHLRWKLPISIAAWHPSQDLQRMWVAYLAGSREAINSMRASDRVSVDISRKLEPATNSFSQVAKAGAWARFSHVDGVSSPKTPVNKPSPNPMFEGAVSNSDIAGLPLPSPFPGTAEAKGPLGVLPKAKGNSAEYKLKKRMTARQIIPWIKRGLAIAALLTIIFGVWKGAAFLKDFALMVDSTIQSNSIDSTTNKKSVNAEDGTTVGKNSNSSKIFDKQKDATTPIAVDKPTDAFATKSGRVLALSESVGRRLLNQLQSDFPSIDFPVKASDQSFIAFSIPGSESLLTSLGFGLATPHQFFLLKQENQGNAWSLYHKDGEQGLLQGTLSATTVNDDNGKSRSQFSWNWQTSPEASLASEIKSGTFVVWLHESPEIMATIPLSLPSSGNPSSLLDALYEGINFKAHLFEELARPETAIKIKWLAEPIGIPDQTLAKNGAPAVADQLWVVTSQTGNTCVELSRLRLVF